MHMVLHRHKDSPKRLSLLDWEAVPEPTMLPENGPPAKGSEATLMVFGEIFISVYGKTARFADNANNSEAVEYVRNLLYYDSLAF